MERLDLAEIRNAIQTCLAGKGETEVYGVANALIRSMNAGMDCVVLFQNRMINGKKMQGFVTLKDKDGKQIFPLFTNMNEMKATKLLLGKQGNVEAGVMNLKAVIQMLVTNKVCDRIIIDPVGLRFQASIGFCQTALNRSLKSHITMIQADITELYTDAIVSATDEKISGESGVDAAIQEAGGESFRELLAEKTMDVADVFAVKSDGKLHSKLVLFTRGPIYSKDMKIEELMECYLNCLNAAKDLQCMSIAFPCISAGMNGVPMELVIGASTKAVTTWMGANPDYPIDVYFCCLDNKEKELYQKFFEGIRK